jgi:hypothetical protein
VAYHFPGRSPGLLWRIISLVDHQPPCGGIIFFTPKVTISWLSLLLHIRKLLGSNLGPKTYYSKVFWGFPQFPQTGGQNLKLRHDSFLPQPFQPFHDEQFNLASWKYRWNFKYSRRRLCRWLFSGLLRCTKQSDGHWPTSQSSLLLPTFTFMEGAASISETSVSIYQTAWCSALDDNHLYWWNHR